MKDPVQQAMGKFERGDPDGAMNVLERALKKSPGNVEVLLARAQILLACGMAAEALESLERAREFHPERADTWCALAAAHRQQLSLEQAAQAIEQALRLAPQEPEGWAEKARILKEQGRFEEGWQAATRALELSGGDSEGALQEAVALGQLQGLWSELGGLATRFSLEGLPEHLAGLRARGITQPQIQAEFWHKQGNRLLDLGHLEEALERFDRAARLDDAAPYWLEQARALELLDRSEDASRSLEKALALAPENPRCWLGQAGSLARRGQLDEALKCLDRAVELAPCDSRVLTSQGLYRALARAPELLARALARAFFLEGESPEQALPLYRQAMSEHPRDGVALAALGSCLMRLGEEDEAQALLDRAVKASPTTMLAWLNRGTLLARAGELEQALISFERACEEAPDSLLAWCNRGECCLQLDRPSEAEQAYNRALELQSAFFPAVEGRIRTQIEQNRLKEARQTCRAYLKSGRATPDEAESLQELLDMA